jgi:hypothetical protein
MKNFKKQMLKLIENDRYEHIYYETTYDDYSFEILKYPINFVVNAKINSIYYGVEIDIETKTITKYWFNHTSIEVKGSKEHLKKSVINHIKKSILKTLNAIENKHLYYDATFNYFYRFNYDEADEIHLQKFVEDFKEEEDNLKPYWM